METNKTEILTKNAVADDSEATQGAPKKDFVEPEVSEPVDILAATKFFLQVTGGGDV
jgi:hypothetical protein